MIISHSKNFVCLNPPKTGSGLRETLFKKYIDWDIHIARKEGFDFATLGTPRHYNYNQAKNFFIKKGWNISNYFVFTFVRNPWDRINSWFNMNCRDANLDTLKVTKETFGKKCKNICLTNIQSDYYNILTEDSEKTINYIGSFENIKCDIEYISNILKLDLNLNIIRTPNVEYHAILNKLWDKHLIELVETTELKTIMLKKYSFRE